jgi:serine/threonine protein kinase
VDSTEARDGGAALAAARLRQTGETYVFDREGRMLSESRFTGALRSYGLVESDGSVVLRDPGADLTAGQSATRPRTARPLTAMVRAALSQKQGVELDGWRDYRGVEVLSAYAWLPELELGIATEIDCAEAYASWRWGAAIMGTLAFILAGLLLRPAPQRPMPVPPASAPPAGLPMRYGQYTLGRKLGEGGMGVVYQASHRLLRRPTAVKVLRSGDASPAAHAEALSRFEREVQLTSQLTHPNTIVIYDYGETDEGNFFYAMEYVEGVDLERLVRLEGPLPAARIIHFALQVCGSLAEAHAKGLIHRDIKPANLIVCERGGAQDTIKVLDFGLVKSLHGPALSGSNVLVGTPLYMAPETVRAPSSVGPRSDLYSLGAVMHWLATAMTVHDAALVSASLRPLIGPSSVRGDSLTGDPYAQVPADLERVIMRCLDSDPFERPETAGELARELAACRDAGRWTQDDASAYWRERGPVLGRLLSRPATPNARTVGGS